MVRVQSGLGSAYTKSFKRISSWQQIKKYLICLAKSIFMHDGLSEAQIFYKFFNLRHRKSMYQLSLD